MNILVVDDEQVILDSARRILSSAGHIVVTADDAETAVKLLQSKPPDIVLTDLILPGMSGQKLMEEVHRHDPNIPVVMTTGYSTVDHAVDALQRGALDFLPKPFTFEELLSPMGRAVKFVCLPLAERQPGEADHADGRYHLGRHTWAYMNEDGTALLGLSALLLQTVECIRSITLPRVDDRLRQGETLIHFKTEDDLVHRAWVPLSGRVLSINQRLEELPDLPHTDPVKGGWLVKVEPTDPAADLARLRQAGKTQHNSI